MDVYLVCRMMLFYPELLWRAPEFLREPMPPSGTPEADVYSFGIILQEVVIRGEPYDSAQVLMDIEGSRNVIVVVIIIVIKQMYFFDADIRGTSTLSGASSSLDMDFPFIIVYTRLLETN